MNHCDFPWRQIARGYSLGGMGFGKFTAAATEQRTLSSIATLAGKTPFFSSTSSIYRIGKNLKHNKYRCFCLCALKHFSLETSVSFPKGIPSVRLSLNTCSAPVRASTNFIVNLFQFFPQTWKLSSHF